MSAETRRDTPVHLRDYRKPAWRVERIDLDIDLDVRKATVAARLELRRDPALDEPLALDGEGFEIVSLRLDGRDLAAAEYTWEDGVLRLPGARDGSVLESVVAHDPSANSALQGLYLSGSEEHGFLVTQCEAQGFRRITFFPDRPDVLARYGVTLRADRARFPVLLSNGNPAGNGEAADGRHWARWEDPHPKPSYLFALVAGRLESIERPYVTADGRAVTLRIFAEPDAIARCGYAMDALERAMRWDETRYGRNYDLDVFHIVATHDFNMGAMENKGLNIFNAKYLLADPARSSDDDYRHVEAIVAHEYFHNWTGNRVTCRDWFQLSLKEGLTVFREQQFSADMGSRALKRIEDVQLLRRAQFPEDAGPLAHPVRPQSYTAIDNFYTATVYDKGAELIRMVAGRLGETGWRRGMDEYFRRHDGQAASIEAFLAALGEPNGADLSPYLAWYEQAGTPEVRARGDYDAQSKVYTLSLRQHTAATPGQANKRALPIPLRLALLGEDGRPLPLRLAGETSGPAERVIELDASARAYRFLDIERPRVASLLRGFSAPIRLDAALAPDDLAFLLRHDTDEFNRWDASQQLARLAFDALVRGSGETELGAWTDALAASFDDASLDPALLAELITPPDVIELTERVTPVDPLIVHASREAMENALARRVGEMAAARHEKLARAERGALDGASQNRRRLLNRCLALWMRWQPAEGAEVAATRYVLAPGMTERQAALAQLVMHGAAQASTALADFETRYRDDAITLDKWFALQAQIPHESAVERVAALMDHPRFSLRNPNRVHALLRTFAARNLVGFHRADGAGYALMESVLARLDRINPTTAARLATALKDWRRLEPGRRELMRQCLERLNADARSAELTDILRRSLA